VGRKSSIDKQPPAARKAAERAARDPAATIETAVENVSAAGGQVSKSAMGRWLKNAREELSEHRKAQEIAGLWVKQLGENPEGDVGVLLSEMLKTLAIRVVADARNKMDAVEAGDKDATPVSAMELMLAAKALNHIEVSDASSLKRRLSAEQVALKRQAKAAESVAREKGLTDEQWEAIREKFLGVKK
jgi:hypothetical protein